MYASAASSEPIARTKLVLDYSLAYGFVSRLRTREQGQGTYVLPPSDIRCRFDNARLSRVQNRVQDDKKRDHFFQAFDILRGEPAILHSRNLEKLT
jgi:hypothetical protein